MNTQRFSGFSIFLFAFIYCSAQSFAANSTKGYRRWSSPDGSITAEVPATWNDMAQGKSGLFFTGPSSGLGTAPALGVSFYPDNLGGASYTSADDYIASKTKWSWTKKSPATLLGRKATRLDEEKRLELDGKDEEFDPKAAPTTHEATIVLPAKHGFWTVYYWANSAYYNRDLTHFEHLLKTLKLKSQ